MDAIEPVWRKELEQALGDVVLGLHQIGGGASKEAWIVRLPTRRIVLRRDGGGTVYSNCLTLLQEFEVLEAAAEAGVKVPRPVGFLGDLGGRDGFAMEYVEGETIGRRIVRSASHDLVRQLAEELAKIHAIPRKRLPFLTEDDPVGMLRDDLDAIELPYPAIELALAYLDRNRPAAISAVVTHGDFRIGNVIVSDSRVRAVLDWEYAQLSDPRADLAWPLVRAWRFGNDERHFGGIGDVDEFLKLYAECGGLDVTVADLRWWEILGNARWAVGQLKQSHRHLRGEERSIECAVLGRLAAQTEYELLDLIEKAVA